MKWSNRQGLVMALMTFIVFTFTPAIVSAEYSTLAIEVGTHSTRMSVIIGDDSQPELISVGPGTHSTRGPLESNWTTDGYLLIRYGADKSSYLHPSNTLFNLDHPVALRAKSHYDNPPRVTGYQALTLIDITAEYLKELKESAERAINQNLFLVSIVLPGGNNIHATAKEIIDSQWGGNDTLYNLVYTDGRDLPKGQRDAMRKASEIAGLGLFEMYRISAVAAYPFLNEIENEKGAFIYHVDSSTSSAIVVERDDRSFGVLSSVYNKHLGGDDFNGRVVDHLLLAHKTKTRQDLVNNTKFVLHLENEVEKAKRSLTFQNSVKIEIQALHLGDQDFSEVLTRSLFEELNMDLVMETIAAVDQALRDSVKFSKDDIQHIVFSGGSSNIPFLQSALKDYFGHSKSYYGSKEPETSVIYGAAKLGHQIALYHYHYGEHYKCCYGTRYLSAGIENADGVMVRFADYISAYEFDEVLTFSTAVDYQERVVIRVYEGERAMANQNVFLGEIELLGISPAPKGAQISVRMQAGYCDGYLQLFATDMATNNTNHGIVVTRSSTLHDGEIDRRILEGTRYEDEDRIIWENAKAAGTLFLLPE